MVHLDAVTQWLEDNGYTQVPDARTHFHVSEDLDVAAHYVEPVETGDGLVHCELLEVRPFRNKYLVEKYEGAYPEFAQQRVYSRGQGAFGDTLYVTPNGLYDHVTVFDAATRALIEDELGWQSGFLGESIHETPWFSMWQPTSQNVLSTLTSVEALTELRIVRPDTPFRCSYLSMSDTSVYTEHDFESLMRYQREAWDQLNAVREHLDYLRPQDL